jgi:hypothetical protein
LFLFRVLWHCGCPPSPFSQKSGRIFPKRTLSELIEGDDRGGRTAFQGAPGAARTRSPEWRDFLATGHLPHLAPLSFVGRAITPPVRPRRFDARFFAVDAEHLVSLDPTAGCGELDEIAWFDWDAAAQLDLPSITRTILADVAARLDDPARPIPYHRFDRGQHRLLML